MRQAAPLRRIGDLRLSASACPVQRLFWNKSFHCSATHPSKQTRYTVMIFCTELVASSKSISKNRDFLMHQSVLHHVAFFVVDCRIFYHVSFKIPTANREAPVIPSMCRSGIAPLRWCYATADGPCSKISGMLLGWFPFSARHRPCGPAGERRGKGTGFSQRTGRLQR